MKISHLLLLIVFIGFMNTISQAQTTLSSSQKTHKTIGDALVISLPIIAFGSTAVFKDGQNGFAQYGKSLIGTVAITYGFKLIIDKQRPNGENFNSFPSAHSAVAFGSAAFIQKRYGWKYGIPAYALAAYVGFSRIEADKHDIVDVSVGAALGIGMSYLFTKPFKQNEKIGFASGSFEGTPTFGLAYSF